MSSTNNENPTAVAGGRRCHFLYRVVARAGQARLAVTVAHQVEQAAPLAEAHPPEFAVIDLKMGGAPGLVLVKLLHGLDPNTRIVVLTGYASIATAVEAIKLGATPVPGQAGQCRRDRRGLQPFAG